MIQFERSRAMPVSAPDVWRVIENFMHIDEFAPQVTKTDQLTELQKGSGAKRRCHFKNGGSMVETVTHWEAGKKYRVKMSETGPMPLLEAYAEIEVKPLDSQRSRVNWRMDYRLKYGSVGWLIGQTMMKNMMKGVLDANLLGLEQKARQS